MALPAPHNRVWLALSGGVGGAKLALGLVHALDDPQGLMIAANTGDDFEHLGLSICPDIDTLMYTLAGLNNPETGWGRAGETDTFMTALAALGGETWFHLGDGDLATHLVRTHRQQMGDSLSDITTALTRQVGITADIVPMTDDPVRTIVETDHGDLGLQSYFVREKCAPAVCGFRFEGCGDARPHARILERLADPDLGAIIICPSNPYISIDPILALPGLRNAIAEATAPVIAVSPIVGGEALKGPTAKMMRELGVDPSVASIAKHYGDLLNGLVVDIADEAAAAELAGPRLDVVVTKTVMADLDDRIALANQVLTLAATLGG